MAFAVVGDENDPKTWKYPHHVVDRGGDEDEHGHYTKGELALSLQGLKIATDQATKAKDSIATGHLNEHWKTVDPDKDMHPLPIKTGMNAYFMAKTVPRYCFSAPLQMEVGDNGAGAVSAPVSGGSGGGAGGSSSS